MRTINDIISIVQIDNIMQPCSLRQVEWMEKELQIKLPQAYREFLLTMGKGADDFMMGSSCFYPEVFDLAAGAAELLAENNFRPLPENAFVFWMHQGYQFAFFLLTEGDNPPVYYYHEGKGQQGFILINQSFTDFLYNELKASGIILFEGGGRIKK